MTKIIQLHHTTEYHYHEKIRIFPQYIRLRPTNHCPIPIDAYQLHIEPKQHFIHTQHDIFGNSISRVAFKHPCDFFKISVDLTLNMIDINPFDFLIDKYAEYYPFVYAEQIKAYLSHYLSPTEPSTIMIDWLKHYKPTTDKTIEFCCELNKTLAKVIDYTTRDEPGIQTPSATLQSQSGCCRDTAWLLCELLRNCGLASRFVSGYLIQFDQDHAHQANAELHAWTEVFIPGAGWIGLDPTSGLLTANQHIPLCCAPHPDNAAPISGSLQSCESTMKHNISIRTIDDSLSTQHLTATQWQAINTLGLAIDKALDNHQVNLTMGAEPTYLAEDKMDKPEWQIAALGKDKAQRGWTLLNNLGQRFASGGIAFIAQGKHYPGETHPRWAYHYYWRQDQQPLWQASAHAHNQAYTHHDALRLFKTIAQALGLPETTIHPLYTDVDYEQWRNQCIDQNTCENSLVEAYAIPLHWHNPWQRWASCQWQSMDNRLFLIPGDSAVGYRLPLHRLIQQTDQRYEPLVENSLFATPFQLATHQQLMKTIEQRYHADDKNTILAHSIHTSLCIECKENKLYIFIPPISQLEHFIDLIASIEWACHQLSIIAVLNGYCPPLDTRLNHFSVTPDPGVLEINIHPSYHWHELVEKNHIIEEEAKKCHLTSSKLSPGGYAIASGGGNHITLGGRTPTESPFLRRPDLLRSFISFWQHHPSLSYLFAGLFVGPSSQAPRIDEARHDSLYELELAFQQFDEKKSLHTWEMDRLLRHLLVDMTGNQHRAELCIDKLFCPNTESGRQGLLELRAFEMAPHPKQTLLQILLVRALVVSFWQNPFKQNLIRWGSQLHDRFFLPHFLWNDLTHVLKHLHHAGFSFDIEWFKPFYAFRFPSIGQLSHHDMTLELRLALEPWNIIDTDIAANGNSRTVDSSLERIQLKITGFIPQRYQVTCNHIILPLHHTGTPGEYLMGIRFKARKNPICTHPNIPIHTPLQFDIIDKHHQQPVASCLYQSGEDMQNRLQIVAPSAISTQRIPASIDPEFPLTLDLRKFIH